MEVSRAKTTLSNSNMSPFGEWTTLILDTSNQFTVSLSGVAGRLKIPVDWSITDVHLPVHLFYYVLEGAFEVQINGVNRRLHAGDVLWAGPGAPLHFRHLKVDLKLLRFRLDARCENGETLAAPRKIGVFSPAPESKFLFGRLVEAASAPATQDEAIKVRAYLLALSFELERVSFAPSSSEVLTTAQCEAVRSYLTVARGKWVSPDDLAHVARLSSPYFTRLFTRTFGRNPRRFLLEERMRLASVRLLESSDLVSQIARDVGYANVFTFSRQFKSVHGQSPNSYRAAHSINALL